MKALKKLPKDLRKFLFLVAMKKLLQGVPLKIFRQNMSDLENYEKQRNFQIIHKKLIDKQIVTADELEFLIEYERKRQWEKM